MTEVELTSKDLARLEYHMDNSLDKADLLKYKTWYEKLQQELKFTSFSLDKKIVAKFEKDVEGEDEKLRWKLKLIHEAKHQEEIDEAIDEEDE